jgi:hypothetical protein
MIAPLCLDCRALLEYRRRNEKLSISCLTYILSTSYKVLRRVRQNLLFSKTYKQEESYAHL